MSKPFVQLYVHLVWATWDRLPLVNEDIRQLIYSGIGAECVKLGAKPIAIGGIEDHVHLLASIPTTITVADLAKYAKGGSSHLVNEKTEGDDLFKWQGGYGAFSLSKYQLRKVKSYILNQDEHHRDGTLHEELEATEELDVVDSCDNW